MKAITAILTISSAALLLTGCASTEAGNAAANTKPYPLQDRKSTRLNSSHQ